MELSEEEKLPRIEMHAIDVKTTIFSCEVNLIKLGFHKVLELSNTRNELVILSIIKFLLVGSFCISPSGYLDYLYSFFFSCFNVQSFLYLSNINTFTQNIQFMFYAIIIAFLIFHSSLDK